MLHLIVTLRCFETYFQFTEGIDLRIDAFRGIFIFSCLSHVIAVHDFHQCMTNVQFYRYRVEGRRPRAGIY